GHRLPQLCPSRSPQEGVDSAQHGSRTMSGAVSSAGIPPVRYRTWLQARGDHGTRARRRTGASRWGARAVMKATLRGRAGTAYPAGFTIWGGANCTLDSVLWANV